MLFEEWQSSAGVQVWSPPWHVAPGRNPGRDHLDFCSSGAGVTGSPSPRAAGQLTGAVTLSDGTAPRASQPARGRYRRGLGHLFSPQSPPPAARLLGAAQDLRAPLTPHLLLSLGHEDCFSQTFSAAEGLSKAALSSGSESVTVAGSLAPSPPRVSPRKVARTDGRPAGLAGELPFQLESLEMLAGLVSFEY